MVADDTLAAFALLGDETRVGILRALADAASDGERELTFGELRKRVGARDSGNFNYHLSKLDGRFVRTVAPDPGTDDSPDAHGARDARDARDAQGARDAHAYREAPRYRLTVAGQRIVGAIAAGAYADVDAIEPEPIAEDCPLCGAAMTARYDDHLLVVECADSHVFQNTVPPMAAVERDLDSLLEFVAQRTRHDVELAVTNTCPKCYAPLSWDLDPDPLTDEGAFQARCDNCGAYTHPPAGLCHVHSPPVAAFYYENGVDPRDTPPWHPVFWRTTVEAVGRDPLRLALVTTLDGSSLRVTVDSELTPFEFERGAAVHRGTETSRER